MIDRRRTAVLLTVQVALLGEISANVRAVFCEWDDVIIQLRWVFDGAIADDDRNSMSCVDTEIYAGFPGDKIESEGVRVDFPAPLAPFFLKHTVYRRKEPETMK